MNNSIVRVIIICVMVLQASQSCLLRAVERNYEKYQKWEAMPIPGVTDIDVEAMTFDPDGRPVIVFNQPREGEDNASDGILVWEDGAWQETAAGFLEQGLDRIHSLAFSNSGILYVGSYEELRAWDGEQWSTLGEGLAYAPANGQPPLTKARIESIAVDSQGNLYVAGIFNRAGGNIVNNLAVWDGESWAGIERTPEMEYYPLSYTVRAYWPPAVFVDAQDRLYLSGPMVFAEGGKTQFARWDGETWTRLPDLFTSQSLLDAEVFFSDNLSYPLPAGVDAQDRFYARIKTQYSDDKGSYRVVYLEDNEWRVIGLYEGISAGGCDVDPAGYIYVTGYLYNDTFQSAPNKLYRARSPEGPFYEFPFLINNTEATYPAEYNVILGFRLSPNGDLYAMAKDGFIDRSMYDFMARLPASEARQPLYGLSGGFKLTFNLQDVATPQTAYGELYNYGNETVTLSGVEFPEGMSGTWPRNTIKPGTSLPMTVTFTPMEANGVFDDFIYFLVDGAPVAIALTNFNFWPNSVIPYALWGSQLYPRESEDYQALDYYLSEWFGGFFKPLPFYFDRYLFSMDFGWVWVDPRATPASMWWWSFAIESWMWGSANTDRFFYRNSDGKWVFVVSQEGGGAWLNDPETDAWTFLEP